MKQLTRREQAVELEKQLLFKKMVLQSINNQLHPSLPLVQYDQLCRDRALITVDMRDIRDKLENLRQGRCLHGEPELYTEYKTAVR